VTPPARGRRFVARTESSLRIDDLDREIVAELTRDARRSYATIGDRVGLSAPAVKRRVDRLRREGVIVGFSAVVNPEATGSTEAFVEVYCREPISAQRIAQVTERYPQVVAAYIVSGEPDALVHVRASDVAELDDVLERLRADLHAERTRSSIVLAALLERMPPILSGDEPEETRRGQEG
jgi:DNA-binding Lrp family transcriptional regulator